MPFLRTMEPHVIEVRGRLELQGKTREHYRVHDGAALILRGKLVGTVDVLQGGQCWLFGGLEGTATNHGGMIVAVGVEPSLITTLAGKTRHLPAIDAVLLTQGPEGLAPVNPPDVRAAWRNRTS